MSVEQSGVHYEVVLALDCHDPMCDGQYELITEFSNAQELWRCPKCKDRYFAWSTEAKFDLTPAEFVPTATERIYDAEYHSEAIGKDCAWCKKPFVTYDINDELCEACSVTDKVGWKN
jgi:hypothetical protein